MANINFDGIKETISSKFKFSENKAKSDGTTIEKHVDDLLKKLDNFSKKIKNLINDEESLILKIAILFHDIGKINKLFQKKLKDKTTDDLIPHNCISPLFLKKINNQINYDWFPLLSYIIYNHHKKGYEYLKKQKIGIQEIAKKINENQRKIFCNFEFKDETVKEYKKWLFSALEKRKNKEYILLSGLLIRLDHAASGDLDVEEEPIKTDRKELLLSYLKKNNKPLQLRKFQERFGINEKSDYQCIVADTGLGKTGLSVLWSNRKKFYILPNRASVNAMYYTLKEIYGDDKVGLLHSTSLFNLLSDYEDDLAVLRQYDQTRVLSKPVTVCTADQLFTAAFNMPGYEKIYATLSYSDVIIDEIQGFQPQQIIPILKQIKETKELGARYLIITATLPDVVAQKLREYGFCVITNDNDTIDQVKRHKIKIENYSIEHENLINKMIKKCGENKKVLVVTNTVRKSQEVYKKIKEKEENIDLNILHSRFVWKDRQNKEEAILEVCKQDEKGNYQNKNGCIWVCTQLVEASLDIDFDYLFTEAATADSLIQRMGRIWRHRTTDYSGKKNIIIASNVESKIYEKILVEKSLEMIKDKTNQGFLLSVQKREIVKELYSETNLKGCNSRYLDKWKKFENIINSGWDFILEENAQKAFRDVMTVELIPAKYKENVKKYYDNMKTIFDKIEKDGTLSEKEKKEQKRLERMEILKKIQEYKVPVPIYLVNPNVSKKLIETLNPIEWLDRNYEIGFLNENYEYDENIGLTGKAIETEESENII